MLGKVRLYDYRCFRREAPATLEFHKGFTSFIGPNNAGKSTLIRVPYEIRNIIHHINSYHNTQISATQVEYSWSCAPLMYEHAEIVNDRNSPTCSIDIEPSLIGYEGEPAIGKIKITFNSTVDRFYTQLFDENMQELRKSFDHASLSDRRLVISGRKYTLKPLLDFLEILLATQYIGPFRNAINEGATTYYDVQVGTGFVTQWNNWKTGGSKSQSKAILEVTEDVRKLIGAERLEINMTADGKSLQVIIDGRNHKLQELGAGIAQLIMILSSALVRKPSLILIDEPELHLHPSLQLDFLTTLAKYTTHGVMFTTHSIGLARQAAEHCFTVQRKDGGSIVRPYEKNPQLAEFLGSLGIAGLQELGWENILLVEGITDVRVAQALLRTFNKERSTIVLPLGGDSMVTGKRADELSEVVRLAGSAKRVFALVDSEKAAENAKPIKARLDFEKVCQSLGISLCLTEYRAIENYLTQSSLDEAFPGAQYVKLGPYDKLSNTHWGKNDNWRAAQKISREELEKTDIGRFLKNIPAKKPH